MMGLVKGTPFREATRKSVIFSSEGPDLLLTLCMAASGCPALVKKLAKLPPTATIPADLKSDRRSHRLSNDDLRRMFKTSLDDEPGRNDGPRGSRMSRSAVVSFTSWDPMWEAVSDRRP